MTLALTIVGTCHPVRAIAYVVAQLLGSIAGAALLLATTSPSIDRTGGLGSNGRQSDDVTIGNALIAEIMGTALLCFVVLASGSHSPHAHAPSTHMQMCTYAHTHMQRVWMHLHPLGSHVHASNLQICTSRGRALWVRCRYSSPLSTNSGRSP